MTTLDSEDPLLTFTVAWEPYGGASAADVFVEFGLHMAEYRRRLVEQLTSPSAEQLEPALRERLLAYSTRPPAHTSRRRMNEGSGFRGEVSIIGEPISLDIFVDPTA
ncbi:hypothetical protein CH254_24365 [Rhodococcus sp. 06-412-2C]|uniref:hypothetical protein n=1 Tax=unclassified Rhodococcus (in: high G+C Gram-positive bacteria) TaxID=192944 RepID=UPI000B9A202C|nr:MULTISPECIES: hypothetical protein [unclassified Rhodococcus (in: high G+C Gram-positive bacteria)]OZC84014.1 hypothetical protein CH254_24365 [Rhodococcus sp. 06-412-2C]OZC94201.1 hypothetical protein CH279_22450 [Rhodococcus sp. 06-412-2B]